MSFAP
jgi:hypothetical protein